MVDYAKRFASIAEKKEKLELAEQHLLDRRKKTVSHFAEQLGLLIQSDEIIYGMFLEAQQEIEKNSDKVKQWALAGKDHVKHKPVEEPEKPIG